MLLAGSSASDSESNELLWKEMKEGNEFAFKELFERNSSILFQYGLTINRERELVKDCIQELFIALWVNRQNIGFARSVRYYLFFSLRRLILKKSGKSKMLLSLNLVQDRLTSGDNQVSVIIEAHDKFIEKKEVALQKQALLASVVKNLPVRQREIIFLRFYQELEFKEIEEIMNLNNQTVRNTLYKALKNLRTTIKNGN